MTTPPVFLTPSEAAEALRMKESRLRKLAQSGLIGYHRDGRFLKFTEADLHDYREATQVRRGNPFETTGRRRRRTA